LQIIHIPGKENVIADSLSRRPDLRCLLLATAASSDLDPSTRRIVKAQKRDKFCQRKLQEARNPNIQSSWQELSGILTSTHDDCITIYVPESLRSVILKEFHDSALAGHCGWKKVFHALQQWYYWEMMEKDVKAFVQACPHCQWYEPTIQPVPPNMPKPVPQRPFSEISLDWVGPLPVSTQQHDSLLNIINSFTKYAICIPVTRSMTTKQLIDTLWGRLFTNVGLPMKIIGDRDTRLTADTMRALCKQLRIRLSLSAAYRPQKDGQTECFNRTFMSLLCATISQFKGDWEKQLPTVVYAYNTTIHSATGFAPDFLLYGWHPTDIRVPLVFQNPSMHPDIDLYLSQRAGAFKAAQAALEKARSVMIAARGASSNAHVYKVGDLIKISTKAMKPKTTISIPKKFQPLFIGPFTITSFKGPKTVCIDLPANYRINNAFNTDNIRPWLHHDSQPSNPRLQPPLHDSSSCNPVIAILDRRHCGRVPTDTPFLQIPCENFVLRESGELTWLSYQHVDLESASVRELIIAFECRYQRDMSRPCNGVSSYDEMDDDGYESPDEVPLGLRKEIVENLYCDI
jgi:hypothetical protein